MNRDDVIYLKINLFIEEQNSINDQQDLQLNNDEGNSLLVHALYLI